MRTHGLAAVIAIAALYAAPASSGTLSLGDFNKAHAAGPLSMTLSSYLYGIADGFASSNASLRGDGHPMMFCQPEKLRVNLENLVQMVDDEVARCARGGGKPYRDELPVALILLEAMKRTFPCEK